MIFGALLGTAATQAANLATAMIVARALLPEGRGDLQLVVLWPMLAAQIASLSLNEALLVLTASGSGDRRRSFAAGLWITLVLALLAAIVAGFWLAPSALALRPNDVKEAGRLCLWLVPATMLSTFFLDALRGRLDHRGWTVLRTVQALAYLAGTLVAWHLGSGLVGFALAFVASHGLALATSGLRLAALGGFAVEVPDKAAAAPLVSLGLRLHTGFVIQVLGGRVDQIAIAILLDPASLGLYAAAMTLVLGLLQLAQSVSQAMFPRVLALPERPAKARQVRRTLALVLGGVAIAAILMFALAEIVIRLLFGAAFAPAADLVRLLLIGIVPHASREVFMLALKVEGRPLAIGRAEAMSLGFFAGLLALLVPRYGAVGTAVAYAATQWLVAGIMAWQCRGLLTLRGG
ncbi:MAG: oligosaccharide flippase family protein [Rhodospirillaceae bacterium]|nr:oligosaccharide flippase family protein [Rhodospirillaceae bacterium]